MGIVNDVLNLLQNEEPKNNFEIEIEAFKDVLAKNGIEDLDIKISKEGLDYFVELSDGEDTEVLVFGVDEEGDAYMLPVDGQTDDPLGDEADIIDLSPADPILAEDGSLDMTDLSWMNKSVVSALFCESIESLQNELDEKIKTVIRGGKKIKLVVKTRKKRMSPKQKMALAKARKKGQTPAAKRKRALSMKLRKRAGL